MKDLVNLQEVKKNFEDHGFDVLILETIGDVITWLKVDFPQVETVGRGGSVTLNQLGIGEILAARGMTVYDHAAKGVTDVRQVFKNAAFADAYLASANALIADGRIFNVDGNGNRVGALAYGPKHIFYIVGKNKIVADFPQAWARVKAIAAPKNVARLQKPNPCLKTGKCEDCNSPNRICAIYSLIARAPKATPTTIVLVNEELGY